jgi:TolA-binding protein
MADSSLDFDMIIVSGVAVLFSLGAWISSTRARREQTKLNRERIEEEAFVRIQGMYTSLMTIQEEQLKTANSRIAEQNKRIHDLEEQLNLPRNRGPP